MTKLRKGQRVELTHVRQPDGSPITGVTASGPREASIPDHIAAGTIILVELDDSPLGPVAYATENVRPAAAPRRPAE